MLSLIEEIGKIRKFKRDYRVYGKIRCSFCNKDKIMRVESLNKYKSCGCQSAENARKMFTKHGLSNSNVKPIYYNMLSRCYNPKSTHYKHYGGRGLTVSEHWLKSIENFYNDMGDRPENGTLERIDNDKGYSKENCKWASRKEQSNNTRSNVYITHNGVKKNIQEWSKTLNINHNTLRTRCFREGVSENVLREVRKYKSNFKKQSTDCI